MDVEITKMDGDSFRLSEYGVTVQDFNVSSVPVTGIYGTVEGRSGTVEYGAEYGPRPISVPFYMKANDFADYPLLRDELFSLVVTKDPFYIREMRRMTYGSVNGIGSDDVGDRFVGGKRYKVRIGGSFNIDQQFRYGFGELSFETVESPFAESIGTTQDIHQNGISANDELWGFGMGLQSDPISLRYTFDIGAEEGFRVHNSGNVLVHPFEQYLKITVTNITNANGEFRLVNQKTSTNIHVFDDDIKQTDVFMYDGANVTKNGLTYLRHTNKNFINIDPGYNRFELYYCESATIEFDFRFYYL